MKVWISTNGVKASCYHKYEDCKHLNKANGYRIVDEDAYPTLRMCLECAGETKDSTSNKRGLRYRLEAGDVDYE